MYKESQKRPEPFVERDKTAIYTTAQKQEVLEQLRTNLQYIVRLAQQCGVKVALITVPCNLRDWHPEHSTITNTLSNKQQLQRAAFFRSGKQHLTEKRFRAAAADLSQASEIAPEHAETYNLLAKAFEGFA